MKYPSVFKLQTIVENKERLSELTVDTKPLWGKMDAGQMLAHLNITYDFCHGKKKAKLNPLMKFFLKKFVKKTVVGDKPYPKNGRTAPYFLVTDEKVFSEEKAKLIENMEWVIRQGEDYFKGRPTASFGSLSSQEWSNLFQKHLDHHFTQFGV